MGAIQPAVRRAGPDWRPRRRALSTEVAWNIGGGVKAELTDRLIGRADLRRFQANDFAPDHWRLYGGLTSSSNDKRPCHADGLTAFR
jgi:hypothetical protein